MSQDLHNRRDRRNRRAGFLIWLALLALALTACDGNEAARAQGQVPPQTRLRSESLDQLIGRGEAETEQGDYAQAVATLRRADALAKSQQATPATLERLLGALGSAERELEDSAAATSTFQRLLKLRQDIYGKDSNEAALAMNDIGENYSLVPDADNAAIWLEQAKNILEANPEHEEGDLALVLHNLASVHYYRDENATARELWERVLAIRTRLYGADSSSVATTLYNLGWLADDDGRTVDARRAFARALANYEKQKGRDHPDVALTLAALADLDCRDDAGADCSRALPRLERAVVIQRRAYGPGQSVLLETLRTLALRYERTERTADARPLREELLEAARAKGDEDAIEEAQADLDALPAAKASKSKAPASADVAGPALTPDAAVDAAEAH